MREDRPSYTARRVAAQRAHLSRPRTPDGDPDAERRLYAGLDGPLVVGWLDSGRMARRTQWFADATLDAIAAGIRQIVIVGAGYDGRALRFKSEGVHWMELDHPASQRDKRRRLDEIRTSLDHISFAALDLLEDDLDAVLDGVGHDPTASTLFICEGLLGYLPTSTIESLLTALQRRSTPTSRLAANFRVSEQPRWLGDHVGRAALDGILRFLGETRLTEFREGDPEQLLQRTGWRIDKEDTSDSTRLDGGSHGLLVIAVPVEG